MKSPLRHRALAMVAGGAMAVSTVVALSPPTSAAPNAEAGVAHWLDKQLVDGLAVYEDWTGEVGPDYGTSLDVLEALSGLGADKDLRAGILNAVIAESADYLQTPVSAGRAAKLALAVSGQGGDPTNVGGLDLVQAIEDQTNEMGQTNGATSGFSHVYVTRTLLRADSAKADDSLASLLDQQCPDGAFKTWDAQCPILIDADTTAVALEALVEAKDSGIEGLDDPIASATGALRDAQSADGSFAMEYIGTNSNSTGLAAKALAIGGDHESAMKSARWVAKHQLNDATATGKLAGHAGAIAFDQTALTNGKEFGIEAADLGSWLLATAQAAPALTLLDGPGRATVAGPKFGAARKTIKITAAGLEPGWKTKATVSGGATVTALAQADGRATFAVRLPKGTATRTVTISDATGRAVGTKTVSVLGAKKLSPKMKNKVKRKKKQRVVVRGFVAGEPVQVRFRGKLVKRGKANKNGNFVRTFRVGKKLGKAKVVVRGKYANRKGVKTFRVVK